MKTLKEHNEQQQDYHNVQCSSAPIRNGIKCPECDEELYDSNPMMVLTSNPPKKNIHCNSCGYHGYRVA